MAKHWTITLLVVSVGFSCLPQAYGSQKPKAKTVVARSSASPATVEPLRVINGRMQGKTVSGSIAINAKPARFSFTLAKAGVIEDRLHLEGVFKLDRLSDQVSATPAGTLAEPVNPRGGGSSEPDQPRSAQLGLAEGTGCEVLFLRLALTPRLRARLRARGGVLQMGVVLARDNNEAGEDINKSICRVVRLLDIKASSADLSAEIELLNSRLALSDKPVK
jgi:hypothetical protein